MLQKQILDLLQEEAKNQLEMLEKLNTLVERMNILAESQLKMVKNQENIVKTVVRDYVK